MKTFIPFTLAVLAIDVFGTPAWAGYPGVAITSFYYTVPYASPANTTAEICGQVYGSWGKDDRVIISVDDLWRPATTVAWPGPDGRFCVLVNSRTGRASVGLWDGSSAPGGVTPYFIQHP